VRTRLELVCSAEAADPPALIWNEAGNCHADRPVMAWLADALMTLLSFGLYQCATRTRIRQHIWSSVQIDGKPLRYTGTVRDLLVPILAMAAGVAILAADFWIASAFGAPRLDLAVAAVAPAYPSLPWRLAISLPLIYLLGYSAWRHRAFLLQRTELDATTGHLRGNGHAYALRHLLTSLGIAVTLGWIIPWRQYILQKRLIESMSIGTHRFTLVGSPAGLFWRFAGAWVAVIAVYLAAVLSIAAAIGTKVVAAQAARTWPDLTSDEFLAVGAIGAGAALAITLVSAWYRIGAWRHFASMTRLDGHPLKLDVDGGAYVRFMIGNLAIRFGSLFLLSSYAELRHARFVLSRLAVPIPERKSQPAG
jgi:uncharacterized membrane protein YjgN (DUF898 family)